MIKSFKQKPLNKYFASEEIMIRGCEMDYEIIIFQTVWGQAKGGFIIRLQGFKMKFL